MQQFCMKLHCRRVSSRTTAIFFDTSGRLCAMSRQFLSGPETKTGIHTKGFGIYIQKAKTQNLHVLCSKVLLLSSAWAPAACRRRARFCAAPSVQFGEEPSLWMKKLLSDSMSANFVSRCGLLVTNPSLIMHSFGATTWTICNSKENPTG